MSFASYYTRIIVQFVIFIVAKIIILRGHGSSPRITFTNEAHIIVANHRSGLDPFAIVSSLRLRDFFRLAPFSFMTANKFMKPLWLRPFAWAAGCFPAHPGLGAHGVEKAVTDLRTGYTLLLFPEGRRVKDARVPAKQGIANIIAEVPEAKLIFAHIEWHATLKIRSIRISYPERTGQSQTPEEIMDIIYGL